MSKADKEKDKELESKSGKPDKDKELDNRAGKSKKQDKNKKPNVFVRMGRKLKETFSELKRVTWPSFGKALKATGIVLGIVLVFIVVVTGVNYGFSELLKFLTDL